MTELSEIRTLMAPINGGGVLLPGSVIAEVVNIGDFEAFHGGPDWLLGELRWNGWQIPMVHMAYISGATDDVAVPSGSRLLVVKLHGDSSKVMHLGIIISGMPRLKNVTPANLLEVNTDMPEGIFSEVSVDDQNALIPDLDVLAGTIESAVYSD